MVLAGLMANVIRKQGKYAGVTGNGVGAQTGLFTKDGHNPKFMWTGRRILP